MSGGLPAATGFVMPAEWTRHERCVMAWPCRLSLWGAHLEDAKAAFAGVARAVVGFEPVLMVAAHGDGTDAAKACGRAVDVVEWPLDDSWARDIGAIVVVDSAGQRAGADFRFNGWGEKFIPYQEDDCFAARMCDHLGLSRHDAAPFVFEGGSITVDGDGGAIVTEECLLNANRNPSLDRMAIEGELRRWLGVDRIVWLPFGLVEDDDTDGHVDNVAAFVAPGVVVAQTSADRSNPNFDRLARNVEVLREADLHVLEIDVLPYAQVGRDRVVVPPTNFYQANGGVVVPVIDGPGGHSALDAVRRALPGREVVGAPGAVLAYGGGGVHCITQQVPAP